MPGHLVPPVIADWGGYHYPIGNGWQALYASQIQHLREIISLKVATMDRIVLEN